ncbi:armadillo-like helical domain-containing protein 4 [Gastrophryne carolinensis]
MKKSLVFHTCGLLCSLVLLSPRATCLSLQKLEKRDLPENYSQSYPSSLLPSLRPTIAQDVNKNVSVPNVELAAANDSLNHSLVLNNHTNDPNVEYSPLGIENEASLNGNKTSTEFGLQTTDYTTTATTFSKAIPEDSKKPNQPLDEKRLSPNQTSMENTSQLNTIEMLTTNPRTNVFKTEDSEFTTLSHLIAELATPGNLFISESPMDLENSTLFNENSVGAAVPLSQFSDDWDDTKLPTVGPNTVRSSDAITLSPEQVLGNESRETAVFTILPGVTVPSDDKSIFSAAANLPEEKGLFEFNDSTAIDTVSPLSYSLSNNNLSTPLPSTTVDDVKSQDFPAVYTDAWQPDSDINENSDVTVTPATFIGATSQETTVEAEVIDKAGETVMEYATPQVAIPADESITEGDDEEEEEEDDDEGDEDEEEEDDEKENVDDSAEKDSDLPLFTLPGLSSQEPLEDDSNVALIDGAAYQVPDTIKWGQQNQGLVRSWMEKLKDKAGYMSGMLVPVGVGIVGALLILGALYSIKIMNRRRRNGFKRHKRKQREFNSMQDRVMLLADSSEDEF